MQQIPFEGSGGLRVSVRTADNALPIEGARVTVWSLSDPTPIRVMLTDRSGSTEILSLPAPAAALSLSPGNGEPYAVYRMAVEADGYYRQENGSVPIFDGVLSLQNAPLIPLAPYEGSESIPQGNTQFEAGQTLEGGM